MAFKYDWEKFICNTLAKARKMAGDKAKDFEVVIGVKDEKTGVPLLVHGAYNYWTGDFFTKLNDVDWENGLPEFVNKVERETKKVAEENEELFYDEMKDRGLSEDNPDDESEIDKLRDEYGCLWFFSVVVHKEPEGHNHFYGHGGIGAEFTAPDYLYDSCYGEVGEDGVGGGPDVEEKFLNDFSKALEKDDGVKESRLRRGRMLKEARITIDLDENKIFAVKGEPDYPQNDNCAYDEILVQEYDGYRFEPGSGHNNKGCMKYASFANRLVDEYEEDEHEDNEEELEEYVCKGLNKEFGGNWIVSGINGSSQGESLTIIYDTETNTDKQIEYFRNDIFGFGYDYTCYNGLGEHEVNVFVNDIDEDETLSIIADACGVDEANVEIVDKKPDFDFIRKHEVKESCQRRGHMLKESDFDRYRPGRFIVCVDGETISRHHTKKEAFAEAEGRKMAYRKQGISKEVEVIDGKTLKTLHDDFYESRRPHGRMLREDVERYDVYVDNKLYDSVESYEEARDIADEAMLDHYVEVVAEPGGLPVYGTDIEESCRPSYRGRMLKEEDERVSIDVSCSDEWSEDGKNYAELKVKKNGKNTPVNVCVVFTDKGEHLDTIFYNTEKNNEDLTENEVAEELDVSVGDIKKLAEKAKIEAMKEFE